MPMNLALEYAITAATNHVMEIVKPKLGYSSMDDRELLRQQIRQVVNDVVKEQENYRPQ